MPQWEAGRGGVCGLELRTAPKTDTSAMAAGLGAFWSGSLIQDGASTDGSGSVTSRYQGQRWEVLSSRRRM